MIRWPDAALAEWGAAAESFARDRLVGRGGQGHADPAFPALLDAMREIGFTELCADTRLDGLEQDVPALARVLERLGAHDPAVATAVYANAAAHLAIAASRVPSERLPMLPPAGAGWVAWPAFHDIGEQVWPALGADGRLTGGCSMLVLGLTADHAVLPAVAGGGVGAGGGAVAGGGVGAGGEVQLVLVDLRDDGVSRHGPVRTIGLSACDVADVTFVDVPAVVLTRRGERVVADLAGRLAVAALALLCGVMRGSQEAGEAYAHERTQGGGPIIGWDEVRRLLSLQQERLRAAQAVCSDALAGGDPVSARYGALHVGTLATELTTDGVQLLGGNGYMTDYGQERRMRDARQLHCLGGGPAWRRQRLLDVALDPAANRAPAPVHGVRAGAR